MLVSCLAREGKQCISPFGCPGTEPVGQRLGVVVVEGLGNVAVDICVRLAIPVGLELLLDVMAGLPLFKGAAVLRRFRTCRINERESLLTAVPANETITQVTVELQSSFSSMRYESDRCHLSSS